MTADTLMQSFVEHFRIFRGSRDSHRSFCPGTNGSQAHRNISHLIRYVFRNGIRYVVRYGIREDIRYGAQYLMSIAYRSTH